jgi:hypothetical protein
MPEGIDVLQPTAPPRDIKIGENLYHTNLPEELDLFEDKVSRPLQHPLRPTELDKLPVGSFFLSRQEEMEDDLGIKSTRESQRRITVFNTEHGKAIDASSFTGEWSIGRGMGKLMSAMGYVVKEDNGQETITAIPTPDTLKAATHDLGVEVEYIPDEGTISGRKYLGVYAQGKYPISTATESDYSHDSEDDHLTAMILGGDPLKIALKDVAIDALSKDDEVVRIKTMLTDRFTATLRAVVAAHHELLGEAYGREQGRRTLLTLGKDLGLTDEVTGKILSTAQENARKFGLEPTELL